MEWATCVLIIAANLHDLFDDDLDEDENFRHYHENGDLSQKRFRNDRIKLINAFRKVENSFEEQPLINIVQKTIVPPDSVAFIHIAYAIGDWQSI